MNWHNGDSTGIPHNEVATSLPNGLKTKRILNEHTDTDTPSKDDIKHVSHRRRFLISHPKAKKKFPL
jgi:hypothetical protein